MNPFDPDDYPLRPTVRRLSHLWWGERRLVLIGLACALAYTTLTLTISVADPAGHRPRDRAQPRRARSGRTCSPSSGLALAPLLDQLHPPLCHRAGRRPAGGPAAADAVRGLPGLPARVLRPAPDGPGRVAGDERPLPDPLLHRLGRRAGIPERDDDHGRGDRARAREPAPDALLGGGDAPDRLRRLAVRPPRHADLAPRPGGQGRRHRGRRRGGRRHRDGAGLRARGRRSRAVRRQGGLGPRHRRAAGGRRGPAPAGALLPAHAVDRRRGLLRRPRRDRRPAHHRPVRPLQHDPPAADVAARGARLDPEPGAARARVGGTHVRLARARAAAPRARASPDAPRRRALGRVRGRPLRLSGRGGGADRRRPRARSGRDRGRVRRAPAPARARS